MKKMSSIFYKWWFQLIVIGVIVGGIYIGFKTASSTTKVNKLVNSYGTSNPNSDYDKVLSVFLRSIYTEDPDLFKSAVMPRNFYDYEDQFYNGTFANPELKKELHITNQLLKSNFGEKWFDKAEFIEYGTQTTGRKVKYLVKIKWTDKDSTYISSIKYGAFYVTQETFYEFIHDRKIE